MNKDLILLPYFIDQIGQPIGNPHHGIVDGTALDDGGAGVTHPALLPYVQSIRLWVTPTNALKVPGNTFTAPADPPAGVTWLDHAIVSGAQKALYQTNAFPAVMADHANKWLLSFGVGDTWKCTISSSVAVDSGGGTAACSVILVPFGRFGLETNPPNITLTTNTLNPCGQPLFGADDFPETPLKLIPFDISDDGQSAILGMVQDSPLYHGYAAPRGFVRIDISKTSATLTLLKSRSEMLVSVTQSYSESHSGGISDADFSCLSEPFTVTVPAYTTTQNKTLTASNLFAAYFDSAGVIQYLRYDVVSNFSATWDHSSYGITCEFCTSGTGDGCEPPGGTSVSVSANATYAGTVNIIRISDSSVMRSASWSDSVTGSGTATSSGGSWLNSNTTSTTKAGTALGGTVYSVTSPGSYSGTDSVIALPNVVFSKMYLDYPNSVPTIPSYITYPPDFGGLPGPVSCIGMLGLIGHEAHIGDAEIFAGAVRAGVYDALPYSGDTGVVVSAHPVTGEIIHSLAPIGTDPAPSYGWA